MNEYEKAEYMRYTITKTARSRALHLQRSAVSLQSTESKLLRAKRACLLQCRQN